MHVSAIDAPSDVYGAVTDVSRPLIYKLNQASMQQSTYEALHALLSWALVQLESNVLESLHQHQVHAGIAVDSAPDVVVQEITPTETPVEPLSLVPLDDDLTEEPKSLVAAPEASVAEAVPLTADMLEETAEDAALAAEITAETAEVTEVVAEPVATTVEPVAETTTTSTRTAKPK